MNIELLESLSNQFGPSGFESSVTGIIKGNVSQLSRDLKIDALGNLIMRIGDEGPRVLLSAHVDEVGVIITHVDQRGFIRVAPLGGIDPWVMIGQELVFRTRRGELIRGVVGIDPPHLRREKPPNRFEELYVDAGFTSREEASKAGVVPGIPGTFSTVMVHSGDVIMGKALDDRLGAYALIEMARRIRSSNATFFFAWNTQEEVGLRGIQAVINGINPELAIVVETTVAADVPSNPEEQWITRLGGGAAIRAMDRSMITNPTLLEKATAILESKGVKYQLQVNPYGGTDAGAIHVHGTGVPTLVISTPARYIHAPRSIALMSDVDAVISSLSLLLENINYLVSPLY